MKNNNRFFKTTICIILVIAILASLACDFHFDDAKNEGEKILERAKSWTEETYDGVKKRFVGWYGTAKDAAVYVYDEASNATKDVYDAASVKASELIGNAQDYIRGLTDISIKDIQYSSYDIEHPIKDLPYRQTFNLEGSRVLTDSETEQFIAYYISSILSARGYKVYNGAAYYKDEVYGGLIFTKEEVFIEEDDQKILSCGFVQLVGENYEGITIDEKMVETGLIAVSTATCGEETKAFVIEEYACFNDFSGIYNNQYFCIKQLSPYVIRVSILENNKKNYDKTIELYDFDNSMEIYKKASDFADIEKLYYSDSVSFKGAMSTANAIADFEEKTEEESVSTVFILDGDSLSKLIDEAKDGSQALVDLFSRTVKNTGLKSGQFSGLNSKGKITLFGEENSYNADRITNGIITTVGAGLGTAGCVASIVCAVKGGVIVVTAIVITTGTMAIVYNVSNMIEGVENVYYGSKNADEDAVNPVLLAFKHFIKDEKTAEIVYHCWGIGTTLITQLMIPVSNALNIAKCKGLNAFQTSINVIRASITQCAKVLATGIGSGIVSYYVSRVVAKVTNNENIGKLVGFGSALVSGMLIYKGLDSIDQKLDISGLYPKETILAAFKKEVSTQRQTRMKSVKADRQRGEDEELVKVIVDLAAEDLHITDTDKPQIIVVYDSDKSYCGEYNYNDNTLVVNMRAGEHQTLKGLVDTIGHEMRHAYQYQFATEYPNSDIAESLYNYIGPNIDYDAYRSQLCEADAFEYGSEFSEFITSMVNAA